VKRIVLAGAGHAHIVALRRFAKTRQDAEIILINDGQYAWYTGALPALIRRDISEGQARLDVSALAAKCGAVFVDAVYRGYTVRGEGGIFVSCAAHEGIVCDALSLSIGGEKIPGGVKPIPDFLARLKRLDEISAPGIGIVGGGAAGVEIALAMRVRLPSARIYLRTSHDMILPGAPPGARRIARAVLGAARIVITQSLPEPLDDIIHAYTPAPALCIRPTLQLTTRDNIFAAGDCALFSPTLPRAGAIAVRQGRVLAHNLTHPALQSFKPPAHILAILSLNAREALGWYGGFYLRGRLPMRIKTWLDGRWLGW
jgi:NADH dehydrogenase FAD-containing subunit